MLFKLLDFFPVAIRELLERVWAQSIYSLSRRIDMGHSKPKNPIFWKYLRISPNFQIMFCNITEVQISNISLIDHWEVSFSYFWMFRFSEIVDKTFPWADSYRVEFMVWLSHNMSERMLIKVCIQNCRILCPLIGLNAPSNSVQLFTSSHFLSAFCVRS